MLLNLKILLKIPKIPRIHIILFFLTILTTLMAGALMEGINFFTNPLGLIKGIPFSFTLMLILFTHEFGHYYYAQKHGVDATLPYFIPAPTKTDLSSVLSSIIWLSFWVQS